MSLLRVFTLNCWGLPDLITGRLKGIKKPKRTERIINISNELGNYDIVGLQEVWMKQDREVLRQKAKKYGLVHCHYYKSFMLGSGLLLLSRYPIVQTAFLRYSLNGKPQRILHGDWYVGKGVGMATIKTPMGDVDCFITHLIASYTEIQEKEEYYLHRLLQTLELIEFVNSRSKSPLTIILGDFNWEPESLGYQILRNVGGYNDCFYDVNPKLNGFTCDNKRIDYIFYLSKMWTVTECSVNVQDFCFSDHGAVKASFHLSHDEQKIVRSSDGKKTWEKLHVTLSVGLEHLRRRRKVHLYRVLALGFILYVFSFFSDFSVMYYTFFGILFSLTMVSLAYVVIWKDSEVAHNARLKDKIHKYVY
eukprot:TRINITY_DN6507_c0_g1_i1.p1 TRINITY_DN6507_c0_g1~~TRINITY_DN6507_c0_g1_i1.p1  ORF type:complete len:362 (-),score=26.67 TRINITY_DN6507_c0_g1_i1:13-1098(-)